MDRGDRMSFSHGAAAGYANDSYVADLVGPFERDVSRCDAEPDLL
jgi:hypothetical protein